MATVQASELLSVITVGIDPTIELGPITLSWHGAMIAIGVLVGVWPAARYARERGLDREQLLNVAIVMGIAGVIGARAFYLATTEPAALLRPGQWLGSFGFAFNGALVGATGAAAVYLRRRRLSPRYLDALAVGFPLGMAVGRIGDVVYGEHYGPPTDLPWAIRHPHPDAQVPSPDLAYHDGGLYEVALGLAIFVLVWPLRHRFRRPLGLLWTVVVLYAAGRFVEFFYRLDSAQLALGLNAAQWTSIALLAVAGLGALGAARHYKRQGEDRPSAA